MNEQLVIDENRDDVFVSDDQFSTRLRLNLVGTIYPQVHGQP